MSISLILFFLCCILLNLVNSTKLVYTARDFELVSGLLTLKKDGKRGKYNADFLFYAVYFNDMYYYVPRRVKDLTQKDWTTRSSLEIWFPYRDQHISKSYSYYWAYVGDPTQVLPRPASFDNVGSMKSGKINYYTSWTNAKKVIANGYYYYVPSWYPEVAAGLYPPSQFRGSAKRVGAANGATNIPGIKLPKGMDYINSDGLDIYSRNDDFWRLYLPDSQLATEPPVILRPTTSSPYNPFTCTDCVVSTKQAEIEAVEKTTRVMQRRFERSLIRVEARIQKKVLLRERTSWTDDEKAEFISSMLRTFKERFVSRIFDYIDENNFVISEILKKRIVSDVVGSRRLLENTALYDEVTVEISYNGTTDEASDIETGFTELDNFDNTTAIIEELNNSTFADNGEVIEDNVTSLATNGTVEYDIVNPPEGAQVGEEINETSIFIVPAGIFQVKVYAEGESSSSKASELQFLLYVSPNDKIRVVFETASTCVYTSTKIYLNGELIAVAAGSGSSGEGYIDGSFGCNGQSWHGANVSQPFISVEGSGQQSVFISYFDTCPQLYTNLHSDFDPILLPDSSLYLQNNVPSLKINFELPSHYQLLNVSYPQCTVSPSIIPVPVGCNVRYETSINHVDDCTFNLTEDANGDYLYQGYLEITASMTIDVDGYIITRNAGAPLSWKVTLDRTVQVSTDVVVEENSVCTSGVGPSPQCNNVGCCESGSCNCTCSNAAKTGYSGTYCSKDIEPPKCIANCITHYVDSYNGGAVDAYTRNLYSLPVITDNSGDPVTINELLANNVTIARVNGSDLIYEFPIGTTVVTYRVKDSSNNFAEFQYTIIVADKSGPEIDCHSCQANAPVGKMWVCVGTSTGWNKEALTQQEYLNSRSDANIKLRGGVYPTFRPGAYINSTDTYGGQKPFEGFVGCDCTAQVEYDYSSVVVTNKWESWGLPASYDLIEHHINVPNVTDPKASGKYNVTYTVTDSNNNVGTCTMYGIIYDIDDPTCDDWHRFVQFDEDNKNFSLPVIYNPDDHNPNFGLSGEKNKTLVIDRSTYATYHVGYADYKWHNSTYYLEDNAGNTGSCSWSVKVNGSGCFWPLCDDVAPTLVSCPSGSDLDRKCSINTDGSGGWTPPVFTDDKGVERIEVTFNGTSVPYTGAESAKLALGTTNVTYTAYDMHNYTAVCTFLVSYVDEVAPTFDNCPVNITLTTLTDNIDYTYNLSASDACVLNNDFLAYGTTGFPTYASNQEQNHTINLSIDSHDFHYTVQDQEGNIENCQWTVTVEDNGAPNITCPVNQEHRLPQGYTSMVATYTAVATDASGVTPTITFTTPSGSNFTVGNNSVTATATDDNNNTDSCTFYINILEAYPFYEFDVALTYAFVSEGSNNVFGADLQIRTYTNMYHSVSIASTPNPHNGQSNDNADIVVPLTALEADCAYGGIICEQNFGFGVQFENCTTSGVKYSFTATVTCDPNPDDCDEEVSIDFVVELSAADYCWQDLESVDIDVQLLTLSLNDHNNFKNLYDTNTDKTLPSQSQGVFSNGADISGIVTITSAQINPASVTITAASRQFYADANHVNKVTENGYKNLNESAFISRPNWASFSYTENEVPLEKTYYTKYAATVELSYDFGNSNRRMLLEVNNRELSAIDEVVEKEVFAETIMFSDVNDVVNPDDAIVLMKLNNCPSADDISLGLSEIIANELRISPARVKIEINSYGDGCLVEATIMQSGCDSYNILDLIDLLNDAVVDPFSDLHAEIAVNKRIPNYIKLDTSVFFVSQTPAKILVSSNGSKNSITDGTAVTSSNTGVVESQNEWLKYLIMGAIGGGFVSLLFSSKSSSKRSTNTITKSSDNYVEDEDLIDFNDTSSDEDQDVYFHNEGSYNPPTNLNDLEI
jgi:hypothetical protein